jgi:hypothetical protein
VARSFINRWAQSVPALFFTNLMKPLFLKSHNDERDYLKQVIPLNRKRILFKIGGGGGRRICVTHYNHNGLQR